HPHDWNVGRSAIMRWLSTLQKRRAEYRFGQMQPDDQVLHRLLLCDSGSATDRSRARMMRKRLSASRRNLNFDAPDSRSLQRLHGGGIAHLARLLAAFQRRFSWRPMNGSRELTKLLTAARADSVCVATLPL